VVARTTGAVFRSQGLRDGPRIDAIWRAPVGRLIREAVKGVFLVVLNVSSTDQATRDGDPGAGDVMRRRRTIQDTSISSREDGGRVKRPLARGTDGRQEKIGFCRRFPTLRSPAQVAG
jgi:hypothetical protein